MPSQPILTIFPPKCSNFNPPKSWKNLTIKEKILLNVEDTPIISTQRSLGIVFHFWTTYKWIEIHWMHVVNYHNFICTNGNRSESNKFSCYNFQQNNMHDISYHCILDTFLFSTFGLKLGSFYHRPPINQNVINCNKLQIFLFSIKRDIFNLELVEDEKVELIVYTHSFMCIESLLI
jgi:hypothetical protein